MKKSICSFIFIAAISLQMLFAQSHFTANIVAVQPTTSTLSPLHKLAFGETRARDISIKAVRDFARTFRHVEDNKWWMAKDGTFTSTFDSDGISTRVSYDCKGHRQYVLKLYHEIKLPVEIIKMVKRQYRDATITLVKEYDANQGVIIYIHLEDRYTWKIVRIVDGQMQLEENLNKG